MVGLARVNGFSAVPRPLPAKIDAVVLDADGSFLTPDHTVTAGNAAAVRCPDGCDARQRMYGTSASTMLCAGWRVRQGCKSLSRQAARGAGSGSTSV